MKKLPTPSRNDKYYNYSVDLDKDRSCVEMRMFICKLNDKLMRNGAKYTFREGKMNATHREPSPTSVL